MKNKIAFACVPNKDPNSLTTYTSTHKILNLIVKY